MLWTLMACGSDEAIDCDTSAAVSVSVTVEGPEDPTVTMITDAGEFACDDWPDGTWACGYEVAGDVTVRAAADGWVTTQKTVTVEQGECHVVGQSVTLAMDEEAVTCDDVAVAAVAATVAGASGEELTGVAVTWGLAEADMEAEPCDEDAGVWYCAWEQSGLVEVAAIADGHQRELVEVDVPLDADGCHPVTQEIAFQLDWLPD